ncbi:Uncharacterized protein Rs2_05421 [Raphanus sativus]|nr:Uncharacterized protein Rs2_05421 [Raphanus sativus]
MERGLLYRFNGEAKAKTGLVLPSSVLMGKNWVFVKKQRVIIVMPSLPLPEPSFTLEKPPPATTHPQAELRDSVVAADNKLWMVWTKRLRLVVLLSWSLRTSRRSL